jgi:hypothetical protein
LLDSTVCNEDKSLKVQKLFIYIYIYKYILLNINTINNLYKYKYIYLNTKKRLFYLFQDVDFKYKIEKKFKK